MKLVAELMPHPVTVGHAYLGMLSPLFLMNVTPGAQRAPPANTKCPLAQASEARYIVQARFACLRCAAGGKSL